ncbi:MAG: VOC family protein [Anaerolineae bacterium]|nr:VOC family protein [Anaerolineae bacterium]
MIIEHVAIWTHDLERLKNFYETYFEAGVGNIYINPQKQYQSYFLTFSGGARLELMYRPDIPLNNNTIENQFTGYIHLAYATGSPARVDELTERLRQDGYIVLGEPRCTGDGYYESVVLDPDGNRIEITV